MIKFLKYYLKINTCHPKPAYKAVLKFFCEQAQKDGFEFKLIKLSAQKNTLAITLPGANPSLPALALNHHMDTVKHAGFKKNGIIYKNIIYGVGTQDMKGVGVAQYFALQKFKQTCGNPQRTVHLLLVPDEEIGGFTGTGELIKTEEFKKLNIGYILDEGISSGNKHKLLIKSSERKPLQIEVKSSGVSGHAANLHANNALNNLILFLKDLVKIQKKNHQASKQIPAGKLLSINITSLKSEFNGLNVIPKQASATLDIRIPAYQSVKKFIVFLNKLISKFPGITYMVKACVDDAVVTKCNPDTVFYKAIEKSILDLGFQAVEHHAQESSDLRFYLNLGIQGFGLTPFTIKSNLHKENEGIRISDLELGVDVFYNILKEFCLQKNHL